ncbi:MAG: glycosyltransferase family 2 protein [Chlorobiaceae bacterium]|nr:glycosyltransferase family 2 protein [Chlorobiaceae bacterium]
MSVVKEPGLVSVIIPFYREIDLIERTVQSVLSQEMPLGYSCEVIIGNDSSLSEEQIRSALSDDSNMVTRIVGNTGKKGPGGARNVAMKASKGSLIAFLDADDYWLPGKLSGQIRLIQDGSNFVVGGYQYEGREQATMPQQKISSTIDMLCNTSVNTSTILVTADLLGEHCFKDIMFSQDTDLWARLAGLSGFRYGAYNKPCAIYTPSRRTANKREQLVKFYHVVSGFDLSIRENIVIFVRYIIRGIYNYYYKPMLVRIFPEKNSVVAKYRNDFV